ncbi:hypothetical protein E2C01_028706 [Portunus trituberculatus]|uniref:Uncharacterized protein n=1 Tax=Portunus trituberculatus TaxID=210409 RepID=A0A5B7EPY0_PORTR|nr:hypothetical protein [Portunus trituberculatus]
MCRDADHSSASLQTNTGCMIYVYCYRWSVVKHAPRNSQPCFVFGLGREGGGGKWGRHTQRLHHKLSSYQFVRKTTK